MHWNCQRRWTICLERRSMQDAGDRRFQKLGSKGRHWKKQCEAWMMQTKSIARAFTLLGTVKLEDVEWHHGRRKLFDELLDQCACKVERLDKGGKFVETHHKCVCFNCRCEDQ
eukprot:3113977-Amphidinium_carterae.1